MNQDQVLAMAKEKLGFVPNLLKTMSISPAPVQVYVESALTMGDCTLAGAEQQVVYLATSVYNKCAYCTSAHSVLAEVEGVSRDDISKLRKGETPDDQRLAALASATRLAIEKRGHLDVDDLNELEDAGISRANLYDIVCLSAVKQMTNWISHIENPEIDEQFTYKE